MSAPLRFAKGHGARNDFVIVEDPDGEVELSPQRVARLAERTAGLGADGVIRVVRTASAGIDVPEGAPEWFMDYRNADGSLAEMCGNGTRVFAAYLDRAGLVGEDSFGIWTRAGRKGIEILSRDADGDAWEIRTGMGPSVTEETGRTVRIAGRELPVLDVDMGNPHVVAFLPSDLPLGELDLTARPGLAPEPGAGANIEFVEEIGPRHVAMRVFERGSGETLACGTGACAVAVAAALRAGDDSGEPWRVDLPGGTLTVGWDDAGEVTLAGPAEIVAEGTLLI